MIAMRANRAMLKPTKKEHARFQKGHALVEFALVLPMFLFLVFGVVSFSIAQYNKTVLTMATAVAARAGGKFVSGKMTNNDIKSRINTAFPEACGNQLISFNSSVTTPIPVITFPLTTPPRVTVAVDVPRDEARVQRIMRCPQCRIALWSNYGGMGDVVRFISTEPPRLMRGR